MVLFISALLHISGSLQASVDAPVYAVVLAQRYHAVPASQMVVKDTTIAMPTLRGSSAEWLKVFEGVPLEIQRAASRPSPTKAHRLDASMLPAGTRLAPAGAVEAHFSDRGSAESWPAFDRQFRARGWIAMSDVLSANDRLNALLYYEARCGGLCGEDGYMWLQRDTVGSPWRIAKRIVRRMF